MRSSPIRPGGKAGDSQESVMSEQAGLAPLPASKIRRASKPVAMHKIYAHFKAYPLKR